MYEKFRSEFSLDESTSRPHFAAQNEECEQHLRELFAKFGGRSFNGGLYRVMAPEMSVRWNAIVGRGFPEFSGSFVNCFGFDWLGRVFGIDSRRLVDALPAVIMLEPGTAQALEIPCNVYSFHEAELIEYREEAVAASFFSSWLAFGGKRPQFAECIGYKRPLFLGGEDTVENLECSDMGIYWELATQLIAKTRGFPAGTKVGSIRFD